MNTTPLEVVTTRANPGVDPVLHVWGWEIPVYLFLGGLVAGVLILGCTWEILTGERPRSRALRWMPLGALGLLSLGMGALFLDLANKVHVYRFYLAFEPSSPMSWGAWVLLVVYPVALLVGLGNLTPGERSWLSARLGPLSGLLEWAHGLAERTRAGLVWTTVIVAAGLGAYTGLLLGTLTARLQWNSSVLAPLFLASGISSGAALLLLLPLDAEERRRVTRWDITAIVVELFLIVVLLLGYATGGRAGELAAHSFLGGDWTAPFWGLVVATGLVVPLWLELVEAMRHRRPTLLAPALVLIGGLSLRAILLAAGQETAFRLLGH